MMEVESATSIVRSLAAAAAAAAPAASAVNGRRSLHGHRLLAPAAGQPTGGGGGGHARTLISAAHLAPHTEYEVSSPPTAASPLTARQYGIGGGAGGGKVATPSPDSAVHSAYYSPSQSPVQSRHHAAAAAAAASHQSGVSSPFSMRTTPSLSRNNSDASQYSSSTTSPLSPTQFSPSHSPVMQIRHALLPASPLPLPPLTTAAAAATTTTQRALGGGLHIPPSAAAAAALLREEGNRRSSPLGDINESAMEEHNGNLTGDAGVINCSGAAQAQAAGISRQQLINRCAAKGWVVRIECISWTTLYVYVYRLLNYTSLFLSFQSLSSVWR